MYKQRTPEWLELRAGSVTSSDISVLMGNHPKGETPLQRWQLKKGLRKEEENKAMRIGTALEPFAREEISKKLGVEFEECDSILSKEHFGFMTSLDGMSKDKKSICEIKCGSKAHSNAKKGIFEPYYNDQVQWHMFVADMAECLYVTYDGETLTHKVVKRDDEYIAKIKEKAYEFLEYIVSNTPPPPAESDFIYVEVDKLDAVEAWERAVVELKAAQEREKAAKAALIDLGDDSNFFITHGGTPLVKLEKVGRIGAVDWENLCINKGITEAEVKVFRKPSTTYYQIRKVKT